MHSTLHRDCFAALAMTLRWVVIASERSDEAISPHESAAPGGTHHHRSGHDLIAGPGAAAPCPHIVASLARHLPLAGKPDWLAPGTGMRSADGDASQPTRRRRTARAIGGAPVDVLVQPTSGRRKRLLVADLESTIIENEMLDELADFIGMRAQVAEITRRAMNGELDFAAALAERVALLRGLPVSVLDEAARRIRLMPGARALVATSRAAGVRTALVSGGFTVFAEQVAAALGFDRVVANSLDIAERTDRRHRAHADRRSRRRSATRSSRLRRRKGVPLAATLAVGDGANDLPMLQAAGLGIAFHAKPAVAAAVALAHRPCRSDRAALCQGYREAKSLPANSLSDARLIRAPYDQPWSRRSATKRRSPWRSTSSRIDLAAGLLGFVDLARRPGRRS